MKTQTESQSTRYAGNIAAPSEHIILGTIVDRPRIGLRLMTVLARQGLEVQYFKTSRSSDARLLNVTMIVEGKSEAVPRSIKQLQRLVDVVEVCLGGGYGQMQ